MENREYMSIPEVAKRLSVSRQYVYKLLNTKLKPYVVIENGKKKLPADVLDVLKNQVDSEPVAGSDRAQTPDREFELIQKLLDEKDHRIDDLQKQLDEANRQITVLQQLLVVKETQKQLEEPKKKSFFSRIFGKQNQ